MPRAATRTHDASWVPCDEFYDLVSIHIELLRWLRANPNNILHLHHPGSRPTSTDTIADRASGRLNPFVDDSPTVDCVRKALESAMRILVDEDRPIAPTFASLLTIWETSFLSSLTGTVRTRMGQYWQTLLPRISAQKIFGTWSMEKLQELEDGVYLVWMTGYGKDGATISHRVHVHLEKFDRLIYCNRELYALQFSDKVLCACLGEGYSLTFKPDVSNVLRLKTIEECSDFAKAGEAPSKKGKTRGKTRRNNNDKWKE